MQSASVDDERRSIFKEVDALEMIRIRTAHNAWRGTGDAHMRT